MLKQQRLFNANWGLLFAYYGAHAADLLFAPTIKREDYQIVIYLF